MLVKISVMFYSIGFYGVIYHRHYVCFRGNEVKIYS